MKPTTALRGRLLVLLVLSCLTKFWVELYSFTLAHTGR